MARKTTNKTETDKPAVNNTPADSGREKEDSQFPGYPHYAAKEDIMDGRSDTERVNVDVENLPNFHNATSPHRLHQGVAGNDSTSSAQTGEEELEADLGIQMGTEADVSPEEKKMLEDDMYYPTEDEDRLRQARLDDTDFDGEKLNEESFGSGQAVSGSDLDLDHSEEATNSENEGLEDEENQYWSLGGDDKDNIAEGTP